MMTMMTMMMMMMMMMHMEMRVSTVCIDKDSLLAQGNSTNLLVLLGQGWMWYMNSLFFSHRINFQRQAQSETVPVFSLEMFITYPPVNSHSWQEKSLFNTFPAFILHNCHFGFHNAKVIEESQVLEDEVIRVNFVGDRGGRKKYPTPPIIMVQWESMRSW